MFERLISELLPQACAVCGKGLGRLENNRGICKHCLVKLPFTMRNELLRSVDLKAYASLSLPPLKRTTWQSYERLVVACRYEAPLPKLITNLKFAHRKDLAKPLAWLLLNAVKRYHIEVEAVLPIPLSKKRLKERGYNQAALIAGEVAHELAVPCLTQALYRKRESKRQSEMKGVEARIANVYDLFALDYEVLANYRQLNQKSLNNILLVDDVLTTGATWLAALKVLRSHNIATSGGFIAGKVSSGDKPLDIDGFV